MLAAASVGPGVGRGRRRRGAGAGASAATCERAGVASGVGSIGTQPYLSNHASTHACASVSRTIQAFLRDENPPGEKPVATRAEMPPIRSSSAIAPA